MAIERIYEESRGAKDAVLEHFVGSQIGSGSYRRVYEVVEDETIVVKVEYCGKEFCNILEMSVWREVEHTPIEDWFAPCVKIDSLGLALVQKKTKPFNKREDFDKALKTTRGLDKVPDFFDDVHFGNFGLLDGKVVCHDYGFNHFIKNGVTEGWRKLTQEEGQYAFQF